MFIFHIKAQLLHQPFQARLKYISNQFDDKNIQDHSHTVQNLEKSEFMMHAAMFDQRLLGKIYTVMVVTLLFGCQISVLSALSLHFIKYKLKRSNADSFHHHLAYLPNQKLYPNIRCRF